jgi:hypothetical protein
MAARRVLAACDVAAERHRATALDIDTSKLRNAIAVAEEGRGGEVRFLGEIDTTEAATRKLAR